MKVIFVIFCFINLLLSSLLFSGCATNNSMPKIIKIPIPVSCPTPHIPPKPYLPIADLHSDNPPDKIIKAYVSSIEILQGYNVQLLRILKSYDTPQQS